MSFSIKRPAIIAAIVLKKSKSVAKDLHGNKDRTGPSQSDKKEKEESAWRKLSTKTGQIQFTGERKKKRAKCNVFMYPQ